MNSSPNQAEQCIIRPLTAADLTGVLRLALLVREAPSWTYEEFRRLIDTEQHSAPAISSSVTVSDAVLLRRAWLAEQAVELAANAGKPLLGLVVVQCLRVGGGRQTGVVSEVEAELESILVHPDSRRHGIGLRLLETAIQWCRQQRASILRLEVRNSNQPALTLYQQRGFQLTGHRPRYYRNPEEDAALMELAL